MKQNNKTAKSAFAERLRELRQDAGLTTRQLAAKLNIGQSSITHWENGTRLASIDGLRKVAKFFGVSADYLIGLED